MHRTHHEASRGKPDDPCKTSFAVLSSELLNNRDALSCFRGLLNLRDEHVERYRCKRRTKAANLEDAGWGWDERVNIGVRESKNMRFQSGSYKGKSAPCLASSRALSSRPRLLLVVSLA